SPASRARRKETLRLRSLDGTRASKCIRRRSSRSPATSGSSRASARNDRPFNSCTRRGSRVLTRHGDEKEEAGEGEEGRDEEEAGRGEEEGRAEEGCGQEEGRAEEEAGGAEERAVGAHPAARAVARGVGEGASEATRSHVQPRAHHQPRVA